MQAYITNQITERLLSDDDFKTKVEKGKDINYPHVTFNIDDISAYIKFLNILNEVYTTEEFIDRIICYRGMEDKSWKLEPSILVNNLSSQEQLMYTEFEQLHPSEFTGIKSALNKIGKMQHFGLPTRLLDFTKNPLVALFFACNMSKKENLDKDARVVIHVSNNLDNELGEKICEHALYNIDYIKRINDFNMVYKFNQDFPIVTPLYITEREKLQQSVFLVFPSKLIQNECFDGIKKIDMSFMESSFFSIIIDSKNKKKILDQLDSIGINKMVLFPELDYTGEYLKEKYKKYVNLMIAKYDEIIDIQKHDKGIAEEYNELKNMVLNKES